MTTKKQPKDQIPDTANSEQIVANGNDATDQVLRIQAELENFRKRAQLEKEAVIKYGNADLIINLLPVLDNFKRAASHAPQTNDAIVKNWMVGILAVERQLEETLKQFGTSEIEAEVGQPFDANIHEAIGNEPSDQPEDSIVKITEIGYKLNDKIIRPAKVIVSSGQKK